MLLFEEALHILRQSAIPAGKERVALGGCLGHVLAENVYSDMDMPPFHKSAVDGYACRRADLSMTLRVLEVIPAGKAPVFKIGKGECSKLMTGGMLPEGADMVIMAEDTSAVTVDTIRFTGEKSADNFALQAEDIRKGDKVLDAGTLIRAQEIAVLASVGCYKPLVNKQITISIIPTGDELVEPDAKPALSQIRNSNGWQLIGQVLAAGCKPVYEGIACDSEETTLDLIRKATENSDMVILTGGISAGDFDFVPAVIQRAGYDIKFRSLAVQPGKPVIFATKDTKYLFALPGNPVSSFVQFEMLVRYMIGLLTGASRQPATVALPMRTDYVRRKTTRKGFIPVSINTDGTVSPVEYHGSAHIHSYISAQGIVSISIGEAGIKKGTLVDVRLI